MRMSAIAVVAGLLAAGPLAAGPLAVSAARAQGTQNPSFNLRNRSTSAIRELYVTPAGDERWGRNRLPQPLPAGASFAVRRRVDGNCIFDIRVVYAEGRTEDRRGVDTCRAEDVSVGSGSVGEGKGQAGRKAADDPSFRLVNRGDQAVIEFYATPAGSGQWGENRLQSPVEAHSDRAVAVARQSSCRFDLKLVLADRHAREKRGADLCRITDLPVP